MLEARLLGEFHIQRDGKSVDIPSRPAQSLLAFLLLNPDQYHRREKLAGMLWPESTEENARSNLRHALWRIRDSLGKDCIDADRVAVRFAQEVKLELDVASLRREGRDSLDEMLGAATAYKGELLPGFYEDWVSLERERLRATYSTLLSRIQEALIEREQWDELVNWSERWLAHDPLVEAAYRGLMIAYTGLKDRAHVASTYERCVRELEDELGVEPAEETQELRDELIERGLPKPAEEEVLPEPTPLAVSPPAFLAEKVEQPEVPTFVRCETSLTWLHAMMERVLGGEFRITLIHGEAGSGKTALLHGFAREVQERHSEILILHGAGSDRGGYGDPFLPFRDALDMLTGRIEPAWSIGLLKTKQARSQWDFTPRALELLVDEGPDLARSFLTAEALLGTAHQLGASQASWFRALYDLLHLPQQPPEEISRGRFEQVRAWLEALAQERPILLLLDDMQWCDAPSLELFFHLARRVKGARILILGAFRQQDVFDSISDTPHPLMDQIHELKRQYGDISIDLDAIALDEGEAFLDGYLGTLMEEVDSTFRQALFDQTRGHPLFTVELIRNLEREGALERRKDGGLIQSSELKTEQIPARIEGVLENRLAGITGLERELLDLAAVEGERFSLQVLAQALGYSGSDGQRRCARALMQAGSMVADLGAEIEAGVRLHRYRFHHGLLRQYLLDHLGQTRCELAHRAVGEALEVLFEADITTVSPQLVHHFQSAGIDDKVLTYAELAGDRAKKLGAGEEAIRYYRLALEKGLSQGLDLASEKSLALNEKIGDINLLFFSRLEEAIDRYSQGLDADLSPGVYARVLRKRGTSHLLAGEFQRAAENYEAAISALEGHDAHPELSRAYFGLAYLAMGEHQFTKAADYSQRGLAIAEQVGEAQPLAEGNKVMGILAVHDRDYAASCRYARNSLDLYEKSGDLVRMIHQHNNLGDTYRLMGQIDQAKQELMAALALTRRTGSVREEVTVRITMAEIDMDQGLWATAIEQLKTAVELADEIGVVINQIEANHSLGEAHLHAIEYQAAEEHLRRAEALSEQSGHVQNLPGIRYSLALLLAKKGEVEAAEKTFQDATTLIGEDVEGVYEWRQAWIHGHLKLANGKVREAIKSFSISTKIALSHDLQLAEGISRLDHAKSMMETNKPEDLRAAKGELKQARQIFSNLKAEGYLRLALEVEEDAGKSD